MFVTLRCDKDSLSIHRKDSTYAHLACTICRTKKLKCGGQKPGCHRCLARHLTCEYPFAASGKNGIKRRRITSKKSLSDTPPSPTVEHVFPNLTEPHVSSEVAQTETLEDTRDTTLHSTPEQTFVRSRPMSNGLLGSIWGTRGYSEITIDMSLDDSNNFATDTNPGEEAAASGLYCDFIPPSAHGGGRRELAVDVVYANTDPRTSRNDNGNDPLISCSASHPTYTTSQTDPKTPSSPSNPLPQPCKCLSSILKLSECLEMASHRLSLATVDQLLGASKLGLAQLRRIIECDTCTSDLSSSSSSSSVIMLTITICRSMVTAFERLFEMLTCQYEKLQRLGACEKSHSHRVRHLDPPSSDDREVPLLTMGITSLKHYEVDASEEPCVFSGLATMQLRALGALMAQLKTTRCGTGTGTTTTAKLEVHEEMLAALEKRVRDQLATVRAYHDNKEQMGYLR